MARREPVTELDARFSSESATPTGWSQARKGLEGAEVYWLSTVRPDGHGEDWHFDVRDGTFHQGDIDALVYEVTPTTAFGFGRGERYSQTRWRFERA